MRPPASILSTAFAALALSLAAPPASSVAPSLWQEGARGHERARGAAQAAAQPLLVYFYTDWCPYCRELQRELLDSGEVEAYLRGITRVRINPEKGAEEARLAREYGVTGYPALFLIADGGPPQRVSRSVRRDGQRRLMTPQEFVAALRQASGR